jgi:hypothetical protein
MPHDEVAAKFIDCASFARWPPNKAKGIVATAPMLNELKNVCHLTVLCAV